MIVEIWSDIICPFCYIGKRRFEAGLQSFSHRDEVKIVHRSFELDPTIPVYPEKSIFEISAQKYGTSVDVVAKQSRDVTELAKRDGLVFHYDSIKHTNTHDAHRLLHFAKEFDKEEVLLELLYKAYFTESLHIGEHETLISIAEKAGLPGQQTADMLAGRSYREAVHEDQDAAARLGIRGVPYFLINGRHAISGAQPASAFYQALQEAWEEDNLSQNALNGGFCTGDSC